MVDRNKKWLCGSGTIHILLCLILLSYQFQDERRQISRICMFSGCFVSVWKEGIIYAGDFLVQPWIGVSLRNPKSAPEISGFCMYLTFQSGVLIGPFYINFCQGLRSRPIWVSVLFTRGVSQYRLNFRF